MLPETALEATIVIAKLMTLLIESTPMDARQKAIGAMIEDWLEIRADIKHAFAGLKT